MRFVLIAALLALAGCAPRGLNSPDGSGSDSEGLYRYTAYDDAGEAVVTGTLYVTLAASDSTGGPASIRGRWVLDASAEDVGPQDGEGTLEGTYEGDTFSINLNPGMADNNVFLQGRFASERARMVGEWSYSTYVGRVAGGRFEAVREG